MPRSGAHDETQTALYAIEVLSAKIGVSPSCYLR
jgi:hypothetical protein